MSNYRFTNSKEEFFKSHAHKILMKLSNRKVKEKIWKTLKGNHRSLPLSAGHIFQDLTDSTTHGICFYYYTYIPMMKWVLLFISQTERQRGRD